MLLPFTIIFVDSETNPSLGYLSVELAAKSSLAARSLHDGIDGLFFYGSGAASQSRLNEITLVYTRLQARYTSYTSASGESRAAREWEGRTAYNRGEATRREGEGKGTYMSQYELGRRKSGHKGVGERRKTHQYIAVTKYEKDPENCIKLGDCRKKDLSRTTPLVGTFSRLHGVEPNMRQGEAGAIGAKAKTRRGGEGWREGQRGGEGGGKEESASHQMTSPAVPQSSTDLAGIFTGIEERDTLREGAG
ncbi:hypothetical protein B0H19DRAFT_1080220 [Mycena capillaripes]|nr:hypothetical protein B0H19DRAFT_1080220 [Mycena capillaripes]